MKYWAKVEFGLKIFQTLNTITKPVLKEVSSGNKLDNCLVIDLNQIISSHVVRRQIYLHCQIKGKCHKEKLKDHIIYDLLYVL